jgi:hypothetical protein
MQLGSYKCLPGGTKQNELPMDTEQLRTFVFQQFGTKTNTPVDLPRAVDAGSGGTKTDWRIESNTESCASTLLVTFRAGKVASMSCTLLLEIDYNWSVRQVRLLCCCFLYMAQKLRASHPT